MSFLCQISSNCSLTFELIICSNTQINSQSLTSNISAAGTHTNTHNLFGINYSENDYERLAIFLVYRMYREMGTMDMNYKDITDLFFTKSRVLSGCMY